jgi:hypothetical protein
MGLIMFWFETEEFVAGVGNGGFRSTAAFLSKLKSSKPNDKLLA